MIKTNAIFHRKENELNTRECEIEKIIRLNNDEYERFSKNLMRDYDFIRDNADWMRQDSNGVYHCLLVVGKDSNDGILVESEGAYYARYSAFLPNAKPFLEADFQQNATQEVKFYSPLSLKVFNEDDFDDEDIDYTDGEQGMTDMSSSDAVYYKDEILAAIERENTFFETDRGLMEYFDCWHDNSPIIDKVYSAYPTVEEHNGELYGVMVMKVRGELTDDEIVTLKDDWSGQYSDGWGEGFEQREIKIDRGDLYVSFWESGDDYQIQTSDEFFGQGQAPELPIQQKFEEKVKQNYTDCVNNWFTFSNSQLIEKAEEIRLTKEVADDLLNTEWDAGDMEFLMQYKNPLEVISNIRIGAAENCIDIRTDAAVEELQKYPELGENFPLDENYAPPDKSQGIKMSM